MAGIVPPHIDTPKTFIGVGARELVILGGTGLLDVVILFIPMPIVVRVGLAMLVMGIGLAVAFGRDRRSGKTLEELLLDLVRFYRRARFQQKGADTAPRAASRLRRTEVDKTTAESEAALRDPIAEEDTGIFKIKPLPLGPGLYFSILSSAFLTSLLAWLWFGGLAEIQVWLLGPGF